MATDIDANLYLPSDGMFLKPIVDHAACTINYMEATAGETLTIMDCVCYQSDGKFDQADADTAAEAQGKLGIALTGASSDGDTFIVVFKGLIRDDTWAWTTGDEIFVSGTAGGLTSTKPAGGGDTVRSVGYAYDADTIWFEPAPYTPGSTV